MNAMGSGDRPARSPNKRQERTFVQRKQFFDSKDREWYRRGIHQLEEQWKKVIESGGDYFDY